MQRFFQKIWENGTQQAKWLTFFDKKGTHVCVTINFKTSLFGKCSIDESRWIWQKNFWASSDKKSEKVKET